MVTTLQLLALLQHTHRMPITASRIIMRDPAKRRQKIPVNAESARTATYHRKVYERSRVSLPQVWGRKNISSPHHPHSRRLADIRQHMDTTKFYPYCYSVYNFATGREKCTWRHQLLESNSQLSYNFPCGCTNPAIEFVTSLPSYFKSTSASLVAPDNSSTSNPTTYEVPCNQVFQPPSNPSKRKRKGLSLTDNKTYRKQLRAKYSPAACSSSLRNLAGDESDQE